MTVILFMRCQVDRSVVEMGWLMQEVIIFAMLDKWS
jgi:hypothetical protein